MPSKNNANALARSGYFPADDVLESMDHCLGSFQHADDGQIKICQCAGKKPLYKDWRSRLSGAHFNFKLRLFQSTLQEVVWESKLRPHRKSRQHRYILVTFNHPYIAYHEVRASTPARLLRGTGKQPGAHSLRHVEVTMSLIITIYSTYRAVRDRLGTMDHLMRMLRWLMSSRLP